MVLGGVCIVSVELIEPCDSASISLDVISSMPRNVVDDGVVEAGGGGGAVSTAAAATAGAVAARSGLAVLSDVGGGGVGERRKFDWTIC